MHRHSALRIVLQSPACYLTNNLMRESKNGDIGKAQRFTYSRPVSPGPARYSTTSYKSIGRNTITFQSTGGTFGKSCLNKNIQRTPGPGAYERPLTERKMQSFTKVIVLSGAEIPIKQGLYTWARAVFVIGFEQLAYESAEWL
jgi:hypothetical protein